MFSYEWDESVNCFKLYFTNFIDVEKKFIKEFQDREDILMYIEEHYNTSFLLIKGKNEEIIDIYRNLKEIKDE